MSDKLKTTYRRMYVFTRTLSNTSRLSHLFYIMNLKFHKLLRWGARATIHSITHTHAHISDMGNINIHKHMYVN